VNEIIPQKGNRKMRILTSRPRRGTTLVEALIASVITFIGVAATLSAISFARLQNVKEQERARAHQIAAEEIEHVHNTLFPRIEPGREVRVWDNGTPDVDADDTVGIVEVRMWQVDVGTNPPSYTLLTTAPTGTDMVLVEVTVSWGDKSRLNRIADRGEDPFRSRETIMTYVVPEA
jgi:Tfp pilus assembly protein PilV